MSTEESNVHTMTPVINFTTPKLADNAAVDGESLDKEIQIELPNKTKNPYTTYIDTDGLTSDLLKTSTTSTCTSATTANTSSAISAAPSSVLSGQAFQSTSSQMKSTKSKTPCSIGSNSSYASSIIQNKKAIYIEPSPSGVTRIHINHVNTKANVSDKAKQLNEIFMNKKFARKNSSSSTHSSTSTTRARSLSPIKYQQSKLDDKYQNHMMLMMNNHPMVDSLPMVRFSVNQQPMMSFVDTNTNNTIHSGSVVQSPFYPYHHNHQYQQHQQQFVQSSQHHFPGNNYMMSLPPLPLPPHQTSSTLVSTVYAANKKDNSTSPIKVLQTCTNSGFNFR
jgi:hypothetical protein